MMPSSPSEPFASLELPDPREQFPRSEMYHPDWVIANAMGSHTLWLTEWLSADMELQPQMRVLDLGCGRAISSIFLAREYGVQVWSTDLWIQPSENLQRIEDAGLTDRVFPLHADAHTLPFARDFFDAIVCVDAYSYFGTDSLYLNYLASFVKPGGRIGIAGAGLTEELTDVPAHLASMWSQDFWALHSADWWRHLWQRTGIVDVEVSEPMQEGWKWWLAWQQFAHPENDVEIEAVQQDQGRTFAYNRMIGRRLEGVALEEYCWPGTLRSLPVEYSAKPLLRS